MSGFDAVLRLILEKSWALGTLALVTFGFIWLLGSRGVSLPPLAQEWAPVGTALGVALIALSAANWALTGTYRWVAGYFATRRHREESKVNALSNIETLTPKEAVELITILRSESSRFQVRPGDDAAGLIHKGILVVVHNPTRNVRICIVHPAILAGRDDLLVTLADQVSRAPADDARLGGPNSWMSR